MSSFISFVLRHLCPVPTERSVKLMGASKNNYGYFSTGN